ncbi:MAG: hypothetical protein JWL76_2329 [Thermoleophilia bacterium]|nr:hypothetical protein [Thermoleophilia bacterium]
MRIPSNIAAASVTAATTPKAAVLVDDRPVWTNPAASAALRSTADLLGTIEAGIVRNISDVGLVRAYAVDLRSTMEIYDAATTALSTDASKENDSFLPLISTAGGGVTHAESRLSSKELASTWPIERGDILAAIRRAKSISLNVADQLDPRSNRDPR